MSDFSEKLDEMLAPFHSTGCPFSKEYGKCLNGWCGKQRNKVKEQIIKIMAERDNSVTRFEVIDHTEGGDGRTLVKYDVKVERDYQDEGRTLKVFLLDQSTEGEHK